MALTIIIPVWNDKYGCEDKKVLASAELLMRMAEDANPDSIFSVEWGEPITEVVTYYTPTFSRREKDGRP
jgi:hypothetical protein